MANLRNLRVVLIGGTSHAGKSTLTQTLASRLGWAYQSTDTLARHPGRPWQTPPKTVPPHVATYYLTTPPDVLISDVEQHYTKNVWPLVEAVISAHIADPLSDGLVIEGSALLPQLAATLPFPNVAKFWLTASPNLLKQRMHRESDYPNKTPLEQQMIDSFLERTLRFNERTVEATNRLGLVLVNVENTTPDKLLAVCLAELQKEGERNAGGEG